MDANENTLLLFSITVILPVKGYLGIIQCLTFDSLLKVFFLLCHVEISIEMAEIPKLELYNKTVQSLLSPVQINPH